MSYPTVYEVAQGERPVEKWVKDFNNPKILSPVAPEVKLATKEIITAFLQVADQNDSYTSPINFSAAVWSAVLNANNKDQSVTNVRIFDQRYVNHATYTGKAPITLKFFDISYIYLKAPVWMQTDKDDNYEDSYYDPALKTVLEVLGKVDNLKIEKTKRREPKWWPNMPDDFTNSSGTKFHRNQDVYKISRENTTVYPDKLEKYTIKGTVMPTDTATLGAGILSGAISVTVEEELNGKFVLEMTYPYDGEFSELLVNNNVIRADAGASLKNQLFVIKSVTKNLDTTLQVYAEHVSYLANDLQVKPLTWLKGDGGLALKQWSDALLDSTPFKTYSDVTANGQSQVGPPDFANAREILGGHRGSILDVWGGEYKFDNFNISLLKNRGKSVNATFVYGKNITDMEMEEAIDTTFTSIMPFARTRDRLNNGTDETEDNIHFLKNFTVDSSLYTKYPNRKIQVVDFSDKFDDKNIYSEEKLESYAKKYVTDNKIGVPNVSIKLKAVDIAKMRDSTQVSSTPEIIDIADNVPVLIDRLGIQATAQVTGTIWNVLNDDYDSFQLGTRRKSLGESLTAQVTEAQRTADEAQSGVISLQGADGKDVLFGDAADGWPNGTYEGQLYFRKDGDTEYIYSWEFNDDTGEWYWKERVNTKTGESIAKDVQDALDNANKNSAEAIDKANEQNREAIAEAEKKLDQAAADREAALKGELEANINQIQNDIDGYESTITQLRDQITQEVIDRENGLSSIQTQLPGLISSQVKDATSGFQSQIDQMPDSIIARVGSSMSSVNLVVNSSIVDVYDYEKGTPGWTSDEGFGSLGEGKWYFTNSTLRDGSNAWGINNAIEGDTSYHHLDTDYIRIDENSTVSFSFLLKASREIDLNSPGGGYFGFELEFFDKDKKLISPRVNKIEVKESNNTWVKYSGENIATPKDARFTRMHFWQRRNGNSYIAQPMLVNKDKIPDIYIPGPDASTGSILSLMVDNWSIGLTDNIGNIISGIVGNKDGMTLIGQNINLQGNVTAQSLVAENIKTAKLDASQITSGKIDASKINVINLDVKYLTGGITAFIKSNWATAYSSVKIDGTGMVIYNSPITTAFDATGMHMVISGVAGVSNFRQTNIANHPNMRGISVGAAGGLDYIAFGSAGWNSTSNVPTAKLMWIRTNFRSRAVSTWDKSGTEVPYLGSNESKTTTTGGGVHRGWVFDDDISILTHWIRVINATSGIKFGTVADGSKRHPAMMGTGSSLSGIAFGDNGRLIVINKGSAKYLDQYVKF